MVVQLIQMILIIPPAGNCIFGYNLAIISL